MTVQVIVYIIYCYKTDQYAEKIERESVWSRNEVGIDVDVDSQRGPSIM